MNRPFVSIICAVYLLTGMVAWGGALPTPPCPGTTPLSRSESPDPPDARAWRTAEVLPVWTPPSCVGWIAPRYAELITVRGAIREPSTATAIVERFGAISRLRGLPYWSVSDHRLQKLIVNAYAVEGSTHDRMRPDYTASEMGVARPLFFAEQDNRATGSTIYKMTVSEIHDDRIVIELENASPIHFTLFTLFGPGDLRSTYILERLGDDRWAYYSLTGVHENAIARLGLNGQKSYINRALALFSFFAGTSGDAALPWAK